MKNQFESTVVEHFRAQFVFPGAVSVRRPVTAEIANLAGAHKDWQLSQRFGKNGFVALSRIRRAECAADRVIDEGGARRRDFAHDVMRCADDERRNATRFDHVGDETDGLMAERSIGNQQREIDLRLPQFSGDGGRQFVFNFVLPAHAAHEGKMKRRQ